MKLVAEHGAAVIVLTIDEEGQARTAEWKVRVAERAISDITGNWGLRQSDIILDCLTFPIATGQEETRRDGSRPSRPSARSSDAFPTCRPRWACPTSPSVSTRPLVSCSTRSFSTNASRPAWTPPSCTPPRSSPWPGSRTSNEKWRSTWSMTGAARPPRPSPYDPLQRFLELFEGVTTADTKAERAAELPAATSERLQRRIIDGEAKGLSDDLDTASPRASPAMEIINTDLLAGMRVVGELFGSGRCSCRSCCSRPR